MFLVYQGRGSMLNSWNTLSSSITIHNISCKIIYGKWEIEKVLVDFFSYFEFT